MFGFCLSNVGTGEGPIQTHVRFAICGSVVGAGLSVCSVLAAAAPERKAACLFHLLAHVYTLLCAVTGPMCPVHITLASLHLFAATRYVLPRTLKLITFFLFFHIFCYGYNTFNCFGCAALTSHTAM